MHFFSLLILLVHFQFFEKFLSILYHEHSRGDWWLKFWFSEYHTKLYDDSFFLFFAILYLLLYLVLLMLWHRFFFWNLSHVCFDVQVVLFFIYLFFRKGVSTEYKVIISFPVVITQPPPVPCMCCSSYCLLCNKKKKTFSILHCPVLRP